MLMIACNDQPEKKNNPAEKNVPEKKNTREKMNLIDREKFSLKYPASWTIDTKDEDYDPNAMFSIDAPDGGSLVMFFYIDAEMDPDMVLDEQEKAMTKAAMKKPSSVTAFSSWGNYSGKGRTLKGKLLGIFKGQINLFVCNENEATLLVLEQYYDKEAEAIAPVLNQIASSFQFKKQPK